MDANNSKIWVDKDIVLYIPRRLKLIAVVSGVLSIALSIMYIAALLYPQIAITGYINGYISLVGYSMYYANNYRSIRLINLDIVKMPAIATVIYIASLLVMSIAALMYLRRRIILSAAIIYGVSLSLVITNSVVRYLAQAFKVDANIFLVNENRNIISVETLAGTIEFIGMSIVKTFVYHILFTYSIALQIILTILVILSVASMVWILYIYDKIYLQQTMRKNVENRKTFRLPPLQILASILLASMLFTQTGATVFVYNPTILTATPLPPPITLDIPPYNYICTSLLRTGRAAITYTDFEVYPVPGWSSSGGTWSLVSGVSGAKGNVLQGVDNGLGLGGASHYYYNIDLSSYTSLWIVSKTRWVSGSGWYGISMMNKDRTRLYTVEIRTTGHVEIRSYNVESTSWSLLASSAIPDYVRGSWYILVTNYTVTPAAVNIMARVYSSTGSLLTSVSASSTHARMFAPAYIGVEVDNVNAYFDDFMIAVSDPRNIVFSGLVNGMAVEVWDDLGNLVSLGFAIGATLQLSVVHDVVVGRGFDGRIFVRYPDGSICAIYTSPDAILGGDVYSLILSPLNYAMGANKTSTSISAKISANPSTTSRVVFITIANSNLKTYYIHLLLNPMSNLDSLTANISLASDTSISTNIKIVNGVIISDRTSWITIEPSGKANATLSAYFPTTGQTATLYLHLQICTLPEEQGACTYYPIELNLLSVNPHINTIDINTIDNSYISKAIYTPEEYIFDLELIEDEWISLEESRREEES